MPAYYNEIDPYAAQWLRNLIAAGHIAPGDVDERSIVDVRADDLRGYTQCHFFAGVGGWSIALRIAGWDDARPVWTGSCPCQPFSTAGKRAAQSDERHLWPYWSRLIAESRPPIIFGEQVADAIAYGWSDEAFSDLEKEEYACASAVLPACAAKAPHKRDRLWFVADLDKGRCNDGGGDRQERPILHNGNGDATKDKPEWKRWQRGVSQASEDDADLITIGREGFFPQTVCGKPREPWQLERDFEDFNGGWSIHSPKLRSVDDGLRGATSQICAYGNAIVPQVAAEFIKATM